MLDPARAYRGRVREQNGSADASDCTASRGDGRIDLVRHSDPARGDLTRLASRPDEDRDLAESGLDDLSTPLDLLDPR